MWQVALGTGLLTVYVAGVVSAAVVDTSVQALRVLLIDNYSSFTFNLYQYIAQITGVEPTLVHNDAPDVVFANFDAIVLSPGPGHPGRGLDFGICAKALEHTELPLLGVCLGHQGLGQKYGATLQQLDQPWHGRSSVVHHDGDPLFSGVATRFSAVRYHSLALQQPLPPSLQCIARTASGEVMALRHREHPHWGLQFHPESIETPDGLRILENFLAQVVPARAVSPKVPLVQAPHRQAQSWRLETRGLSVPQSASQIFEQLYSDSDTAFWLDGAASNGYSFMGDASGEHGYAVRYDQQSKRAVLRGSRNQDLHCDSIFDFLEQELAGIQLEPCDETFSFLGGFVGYLGYELKAESGGTARYPSSVPDAHWVWADRFVAYDHAEARVTLAVLLPSGQAHEGAQAWFDLTEKRLADRATAPPSVCTASAPVLELLESEAEYCSRVLACQDYIARGESYELCLTTQYQSKGAHSVSAWELFVAMRQQNPAPYAGYLRCSEFSLVSASPERFMKIDRSGRVESKPIKGTAPRDSNVEKDRALAKALLESEKEHAENLMIVDLVRNDLGKCCEIGSVVVESLAALESFATVHQLVSTIVGELRPEVSPLQCVRAAFPGGSMTGAPKLRSMDLLESIEGRARGPYSGSLGYLSCDGAVDLSIVIRSVLVEKERVSLGVGGAITSLSKAPFEYSEMKLKALAQLQALQSLQQGPVR